MWISYGSKKRKKNDTRHSNSSVYDMVGVLDIRDNRKGQEMAITIPDRNGSKNKKKKDASNNRCQQYNDNSKHNSNSIYSHRISMDYNETMVTTTSSVLECNTNSSAIDIMAYQYDSICLTVWNT
jgi:hypothetical protein